MWGARLALLVEMQQYREAEVEMEAFGELVNPDLTRQEWSVGHTESLIIVVCCIQLYDLHNMYSKFILYYAVCSSLHE